MTAIIAHRGGALLWPENSRTACEGAVRLGVDQLQVDVHPSRDGKVVVIHDATVDRTTDGTGQVAAQNWAELSRLTLEGTEGEPMLLLEEVAEIVRPTSLLLRLEIKADTAKRPYPGFPELLTAVLRQCRILDRTILSGFDADTLRTSVSQGGPRHHVWLLSAATFTELGLDRVIAATRHQGMTAFATRWSVLDTPAVTAAHQAGLGIGCFGCHDSTSIAAMLALGLDELSTDRPDIALLERALLSAKPRLV
jgi:glycerophosphoryl diester phosphodiesterase